MVSRRIRQFVVPMLSGQVTNAFYDGSSQSDLLYQSMGYIITEICSISHIFILRCDFTVMMVTIIVRCEF
ncbi:hypothetical protein KKB18_01800 [bacterium]|nr:hypothetical protein [bacterium]